MAQQGCQACLSAHFHFNPGTLLTLAKTRKDFSGWQILAHWYYDKTESVADKASEGSFPFVPSFTRSRRRESRKRASGSGAMDPQGTLLMP